MYDFKIEAADKATLYADLASALEGLVAGEPDGIANMANATGLICEALPDDAELGGMTLPDSGMLLHAWRIVVPRAPKEPIDVTAPVPDRFGRWQDYL